ncbi:hypothetical protein DV737_g4396, partial [Chaetothyriales sp. CBS 132003]
MPPVLDIKAYLTYLRAANIQAKPKSRKLFRRPSVETLGERVKMSKTTALKFVESLRLTDATPGRVSFALPITQQHTNRLGILHGATLATLVDTSGSLALASRGLYSTGVSTDISVTYLNSGGKVGDIIRGEVTCDKFGKTLAFTSVRFFNEKNELVARGSHTKFVAQAWKDERNRTEELRPDVPDNKETRVKTDHVVKG